MARTLSTIAFLVLLVSATGGSLWASNDACAGAPKYRVAPGAAHATHGQGTWTLYLQISVAPDAVSKDSLLQLACRLRKDYAKERQLHVWIFTDPEAAKRFNFDRSSPTYHEDLAKLRGSYYLDRDKGEQSLRFSNDPQKPEDMQEIEFATPLLK